MTTDIAGPPAAVRAGLTEIIVGGSATKSILIVGEHTAVSRKNGIRVESDTTGFDSGTKMMPSVRFPGEGDYTRDSARLTTDTAGDLSWQRKTGKGIYVFFESEAGDVRSNRIVIDAA